MIWREKRILLIVLGVLLVANIAFFFTYRVQYQNRLDDLDASLEAAEKTLADARMQRAGIERRIQGYQKTEADIAEVFDQHWSTQSKRFTVMFGEIKQLAEASSLVPSSYSFDRDEADAKAAGMGRSAVREADLGATEVGMSFNVAGTYQQVRRLINLLELSRQFIIVDRISLSASDAERLSLTLHVKTLFRDDRPGVAQKRL
ncbi:MAG TPA: GspMb/PilO family protein [Thermoanaerobaculia bacterium]|nr:GspMb/PilO family protein [Thermoanaerobaculia bacterium]